MQTANEKQDNKKRGINPIRTLQSDASKANLRGGNFLSEKFEKKKIIYFEKTEKNSLVKIISIIIIAVCFIIAAYYLSPLLYNPDDDRQNMSQEIPVPILANEERNILNCKEPDNLKIQITESLKNINIKEGDTIYMPIKRQVESLTHYVAFREFAGLTGINLPLHISYNTEDRFFMGAVKLDGLIHPILIIKIKEESYENALSGLKTWEKTIIKDLDFLIENKATSSPDNPFSEKLVKNQNAKVAKKTDGTKETFFLYSIFNKKYIIITDNERSFEEILKDLILFGAR